MITRLVSIYKIINVQHAVSLSHHTLSITLLFWQRLQPISEHAFGHGETNKRAELDVLVLEGFEGVDGLKDQLVKGQEDQRGGVVGLGCAEREREEGRERGRGTEGGRRRGMEGGRGR